MKARRVLLLLCLLLTAAAGFAEEDDADQNLPEEYAPEEFSPFLKNLRRGEIIFFGSLPLSMFLCFEAYDISRYFYVLKNDGADVAQDYAPWPFRRYGGKPYTDTETRWLLVSALTVSLTFALVDYMIGRIREQRDSRPPD